VTPTGTPLFKDTFQNNNNNWDTSEPSGATISIQGGKMVLASNNNELFEELLPGNQTFSDARVDVDANLTTGAQQNGYGIYIRGSLAANGSLGTYYRFEVYGDGNFAVYEGVQSSDGTLSTTTIVAETPSSAIRFAGQTNHLTVIAKGSQMSFLVNGVQVYTFNNTNYKSGAIALFVSNVQNVAAGADATFTNLAVFPAS
jgi:hypothetical protein